MRPSIPSGLGSTLAWFAFPLVPALLGVAHHQALNGTFAGPNGPDPRLWSWGKWAILAGPLVGYGFLAGATLDLPDDPARRGPRGWLSRRSLWVAVGPWVGFVAAVALWYTIAFVRRAYPPSENWTLPVGQRPWPDWLVEALVWLLVVAPLGGGWLVVAWAALRRARRSGRLGRSLSRGLAMAIGFVGSLFGSFWAITEAWRGYFFDPRVAPALLAAAGLTLLAGCAAPETFGDVRRRELFQAMLVSWLLGLALAWRWWARSKPRP